MLLPTAGEMSRLRMQCWGREAIQCSSAQNSLSVVRKMVSGMDRGKVGGRVLPGSSGSKSVDGDCSLKEKRKRLVRQYATEEYDEHEDRNINKNKSDITVPYNPTRADFRPKTREYEGKINNCKQSNPRVCSSSKNQDPRNTKQDRSSHNTSESHLQNVRRSNHDQPVPHNPHDHNEQEGLANPGHINNLGRGSISTSGSSRRTSNQSVVSVSAYETHFPTYTRTNNTIKQPANSPDGVSNNQAGADIWEPRHSRSRAYQRTQSFRLHPGLVTLDPLDKEQQCCIIQ